jgi:uncharacterized Zn finger protein
MTFPFTESDIRRQAGGQSFQRGESYFRAGHLQHSWRV